MKCLKFQVYDVLKLLNARNLRKMSNHMLGIFLIWRLLMDSSADSTSQKSPKSLEKITKICQICTYMM